MPSPTEAGASAASSTAWARFDAAVIEAKAPGAGNGNLPPNRRATFKIRGSTPES